jgi:hypothetical protein
LCDGARASSFGFIENIQRAGVARIEQARPKTKAPDEAGA